MIFNRLEETLKKRRKAQSEKAKGKEKLPPDPPPGAGPSITTSDPTKPPTKPEFSVYGSVTDPLGTLLNGYLIVAKDVDLRHEQELGQDTTGNPDGGYFVAYTAEQFSKSERGTADLRVYVYAPVGKDPKAPRKQVAVSPIFFNAEKEQEINLVVGGGGTLSGIEYEIYVATITPLLDGIVMEEIVENEKNKDISFLVGETGLDGSNIALLALATKTSYNAPVKALLPPDIFYGLFRKGLPTDLKTLCAVDLSAIHKALQNAIADSIIAPRDASAFQSITKAFTQLGALLSLQSPTDPGKLSPIGDLFSDKATMPDPRAFMDTFLNHGGSLDEFWKKLDTLPAFKGKVAAAQNTVQLGILTLNHTPLVKELQKRQTAGEFKSIADFAKLGEKHWLDIINRPGIGTPQAIPGDTAEEKNKLMATAVANMIEDAFPTRFLSERLQDKDDDDVHGPLGATLKGDLKTFFSRNTTFDLTTTRITELASSDPSAFSGLKDYENTVEALSAIQRIHTIAPRYTQLRPLLAAGLNSSLQISRLGRASFTNTYAEKLGGIAEAHKIFERTEQTHATAASLLLQYGFAGSKVSVASIINIIADKWQGLEKQIPDLRTLFGSLDMCACEGCKSVDGPAAYFVDVLHWLRERLCIDTVTRNADGSVRRVTYKTKLVNESRSTLTAKDVLFRRRPDLGELELSCENTNTVLPYIDLVNEILEEAVVPHPRFRVFNLPDSASVDLDAEKVGEGWRGDFGPPLSEFATVELETRGKSWTIQENSFEYRVRLVDGAVRVIARSRQTRGTAAERGASPQYVIPAAYEVLRAKVYPALLPFDLWTETVRTYLLHLNIHRADLMKTFSSLTPLQQLTNPFIIHESLLLTPAEATLILSSTAGDPAAPSSGPWNLWGFPSPTLTGAEPIPDPSSGTKMLGEAGYWAQVLTGRVDVFLQQAGITYRQLLTLLQFVVFLRVRGNELRTPGIQARKGEPVDTCVLNKLQITGLAESDLIVLQRVLRLWRRLRDLGWTLLDVGMVFVAILDRDAGDGNERRFDAVGEDMLRQFAHIQQLKDLLGIESTERILAFWAPILSRAFVDYEEDGDEKPKGLYARIFRDSTVNEKTPPPFTVDPLDLAGSLKENSEHIQGSLQISAADFDLLVSSRRVLPDSSDALSLENLSALFRHSLLAFALEIQISDYLSLLDLILLPPFTSTTTTLTFYTRARSLLDSSFSLEEVTYLLRHIFQPSSSLHPSTETVASFLDNFRASYQKIETETAFVPDMSAADYLAILKKKLPLLGLDGGVAAEGIGILNGTASASVELEFGPLEELRASEVGEKAVYDEASGLLTFTGVMTVAERESLVALSAEVDWIAAIQTLFDAPRKFLARYLRAFVPVPLETELESYPEGFTLPALLRKKLFFDKDEKILKASAVLTPAELKTVLKLSETLADGPRTDFVAAVERLMVGADSLVPDTDNLFLGNEDISALFDAAKDPTSNEDNTPLRRFIFVLKKLMPKLQVLLSKQALVDSLVQTSSIEAPVIEALITKWLHVSSGPVLIDALLTPTFVKSSTSTTITTSNSSSQFEAYTKLHKAGMIISRYKLGTTELSWLFTHRADVDDPSRAWLDLDSLPLVPEGPGQLSLLNSWERLRDLVEVRDTVSMGRTVLDGMFKEARDPAGRVEDALENISKLTGWPADDITFLVGSSGFGYSFPADFQSEKLLLKLRNAFRTLKTLGCSASQAISFAQPHLTETESRAIQQTIKAKYDTAGWTSVARPLRNILREKQRAALVAYHLANPHPSARPVWRNSNDLYAHFLIDVEMGPCQLTSRLKQAISSTQLFVQRCLIRLEPDVLADSELDDRWLEWDSWLKSQVISSANRLVMIQPENYMEPAVRDDKSPLFIELENQIAQGEMTESLAEEALGVYLESLHSIARLQVRCFYHQEEFTSPGARAVDILHVFATTRMKPYEHYYRRRMDSSIWTPWEVVQLDIQSSHVIPVIWNRKLHLFWLQFTEKQIKKDVTLPAEGSSVPKGQNYWEVKILWSELKNGKWASKSISEAVLALPKSDKEFDEPELGPVPVGVGRRAVTCKSEVRNDGSLRIMLLSNKERPGSLGFFQFDGIKNAPVAVTLMYKWIIEPPPKISPVEREKIGISFGGIFAGISGKVTNADQILEDIKALMEWIQDLVNEATKPWLAFVDEPRGTDVDGMDFVENRKIDIFNIMEFFADGLVLPTGINTAFNATRYHPPEELRKNRKEVAVLTRTPGKYVLTTASQDAQFTSQRPFFFATGQQTYFVEPKDIFRTARPFDGFNGGNIINPGYLDGSILKDYIDRINPIVPIWNPPIWTIDKVGAVRGLPTFDLAGDFRGIGKPPQVALRAQDTSARLAGTLALPATPLSPRRMNIADYILPSTRNVQVPAGKQFEFSLFHHPYTRDLMLNFNRDGIPGLLQRPLQQLIPPSNKTFSSIYGPIAAAYAPSSRADDTVDFSLTGAYSNYNWELFYHIPMLLAEKLASNQRFAEARKWLHYIFDPTDTSSLPSPKKFWKTKPFVEMSGEDYYNGNIVNIFRLLAKRGDPKEYAKLTAKEKEVLIDLEASVKEWRKNPFNPFLVGRMRIVAFMMATVMKYLDVLIAWGDQLFRRDTIESINEATQLYILAAEILGERPQDIPPRAVAEVQTYNSIDSKLDAFSNALVKIEELIPVYTSADDNRLIISPTHQIQAASPTMLLFCVPRNKKLMGYWDTVADRLFKIRNCMNLQGIVRELALFDPPIDPMMLIRARAAGMDLNAVFSDIDSSVPLHRYAVLYSKALELANDVKSLGASLLQALERQDSESLSLLTSTNELSLLRANREIKQTQIKESEAQVSALDANKAVINERFVHYRDISFLNTLEGIALGLEAQALYFQIIEAVTHTVNAALHIVPDVKIGAPTSLGATFGGVNLGDSSTDFSEFLNRMSSILRSGAGLASTMGGYQRRADDWALQKRVAEKELAQMDVQITAAKLRVSIAEKELANQELQIGNAEKVNEFMREKFTSKELYSWSISRLSSVYFQTYQMAFDAARQAEKCLAHELAIENPGVVRFGYWDSLRRGLLSGEQLLVDLKRLDNLYLSSNTREYELTKSISLAQLDPVAFLQFKMTGQAFFALPEAIFDLDNPGHYLRRLKTVSLSIPCVAGPYTAISARLSLLKSTTRISPLLSSGKRTYSRVASDARFRDSYGALESIVTSTAQADSGLFEVNMRDDRYLPFERSGAISSWRLDLPTTFRVFDTNTISDVLLTVRYTAREGGDLLRDACVSELQTKTLSAIQLAESQSGLAKLIDLKHELSDSWNRFLRPAGAPGTESGKQILTLDFSQGRFPYFVSAAAKRLTILSMDIFLHIHPAHTSTYNPESLKVYVYPRGSTRGAGDLVGMVGWKNGVLKGTTRVFGREAGGWVVEGELASGERIRGEAVVGAWAVVRYSVRWV